MTASQQMAALSTERSGQDRVAVQFGRACGSAWLCVRRPIFLLPSFGAGMLFAVLMVVGIFMSAARPGGSRMTDPPTMLADLAAPGALATLAGGIVSVVGSAVLAVAAAHLASPFVNGSVRIQLVRQPRRGVWVLANLAVVAGFSVLLTVAAIVAVVASAYACALIYEVPTGQWMSLAALGPLLGKTANLSASMVGFAMFGASLATVLRSAIASIGVGLVYALFEGLGSGVLGSGARFLPAANLSALAVGGNENIPYAWAVAASAVVTLAFVAVAVAVVRRRDVLD